jgi:threonylcarbamoyladenosine tRNA methylthiotransferase MtaB
VLGNQEKQNIAGLLESSDHLVSDIGTLSIGEPLKLTSFAEHTRAFLQVQNGCNSFCAYCIVPYARGRSRSVLPEDVLQGVRDLAASSFKEIVLTGIHLGAYGLDLLPATSLTSLVRRIEAEALIPRLRIGSVEPNEVSDELLNLIAESEIICPHLHLPLQSGSDTVLRRMGRGYTAADFRGLTARISAALPDAFIGADVIAGFPGESDEEFAETVRLIEDLPFSDLHVFPYSRRSGTRAAGMPGHVKSHIVTERAAKLRSIAAAKKSAFLERFIGREIKVLVQGYDAITGLCRGLSRNYISSAFAGDISLVNREVGVILTACTGNNCLGEISSK